MTSALIEQEVVPYRRSISTGPLLPREGQVSWLRRLEDKLRGIYAAITCNRGTDVMHQRASQIPPRTSTQQQQPRPHGAHRQGPRPRLTPTPTPRPPPPDQPGGSQWQRQQNPHHDGGSSGQHASFDAWQGGGPTWRQATDYTQETPLQGGGSTWRQAYPEPHGTSCSTSGVKYYIYTML